MFDLYSFEPIDTLFFKGAEPMVMGESHSSNLLFPPPAHTIEGSIRTKLFKMDKDKYNDLIRIGEEKAGFNLIGPLFLKDKNLYVPTPYSWFAEKDDIKKIENNKKKKINNKNNLKVFKLKKIDTSLIKSDSKEFYWVKGENSELESLGGTWVKWEDLINSSDNLEILFLDDLFTKEIRTGIALEENRKVRESHLYSFTHIRLNKTVKLIFGIDKELPFDNDCVITLGAEKRFGKLKKLKEKLKQNDSGNFYINLSIIESDIVDKNSLISTGKPLSIGGWDLHKKFHKPMKIYYPAGSVFNKKINENFISF